MTYPIALRNTVKTFTLLAGLGGFLVLCGSLLAGTTGTIIGLVLGIGLVGSSYWFSDRLAVRAAGARPVERGELSWLQTDVAVLAEGAGIATPRLFVSPNQQPNAFATGRNERTALVCVTEGLLTGRQVSFARLFLTHPPTDERVARLLKMPIAVAR